MLEMQTPNRVNILKCNTSQYKPQMHPMLQVILRKTRPTKGNSTETKNNKKF